MPGKKAQQHFRRRLLATMNLLYTD